MRLRLPALIQPSARRDWVTPEDVNVSPALLGHALARPAQRAGAMALDLALIALASSLGNWMLLGSLTLAAWLQIRRRDARQPPARLWWLLAALLLVTGLHGAWADLSAALQDSPRATRPASVAPAEEAGNEEEPLAEAPPAEASSASAPSAESQRITELEAQLNRLRRSEEAARAHSGFHPRQWLDEALGEAGLRFSLAIVYFTLLPVLWPGQTVGKRLLGLKVAELSGKPMTLMRSFSRYGGYLASMGTGGMGFVQLVWDANRQALQDKAAHTVVLDLRRKDRLPPADIPSTAAGDPPTDPRTEPSP